MDKKKLKLLLDVEITDDDTSREIQNDYPGLMYAYTACGGGGGGCGGCGGCGGGCGHNLEGVNEG